MLDLGLTPAEFAAYCRALKYSRPTRVKVQLLDASERVTCDLTVGPTSILGGQVDVDVTREIWRTMKLSILDPKKKLQLTPDQVGAYSIFASNFIRVYREDYVPELDDWVSCPVFTGPVTVFSRNHPEVSIEAQGKELLSKAPYLLPNTVNLARGITVDAAIRQLMTRAGEWNFALSVMPFKLTKEISVPRLGEAWPQAKSIAALAGGSARTLFYDGLGRCRLTTRTTNPVWVFAGGDESTLLTRPDVAYDLTSFRNNVEFQGGQPKGKNYRIVAVATLPASHPLSPYSAEMMRRNVPRFATEVIENTQVTRYEQGFAIADQRLRELSEIATDANFDTLPIPFLEEYDLIHVESDNGLVGTRMHRWTIPLGSDVMPVGNNRVLVWQTKYKPLHRKSKIIIPKKKKRRKKKKKKHH